MELRGDITIESEKGFVIDSIPLQISEFTELIYELAPEGDLFRTYCLQFIDPYGDTTFNMLQKRVLVKELQDLIAKSQNPAQTKYLTNISEFIRAYEDSVHVYVKFHGD